MKKRYVIIVKTSEGFILKYHVDEYILKEGFVIFTDYKTKEKKIFHGSRCDIEEVSKRG